MKKLQITKDEVKNNIWTYVIAIIFIISGIFLILKPASTTFSVVYFIGIILIVSGLIKAISGIVNKENLLFPGSYFTSGILNTFVGIILVNNPAGTTKLISKVLGIWLIISATLSIGVLLNNRVNSKLDKEKLVSCILKLIIGIVILTTPIITILFTSLIVGIILIFVGIYLIVDSFKNKSIYKVRVK